MNIFIYKPLSLCIFFFICVNINSNELVYNTLPYDKIMKINNNELKMKVNLLKEKEYMLSRKVPTAFSSEIYNMVYNEINTSGGFVEYGFEEKGITYNVVYVSSKKDSPNYFVVAHFKVNNIIYWFFKINSFLEYTVEKSWIDIEGVERTFKVFY